MEVVTVLTLVMVALTFSRSTSQQVSNSNGNSLLGERGSTGPSVYNVSAAEKQQQQQPQQRHHHHHHHHRHHHGESDTSQRVHMNKPTVKPLTGKQAFLRREMLKNTSVTCNDGTPAGYYVRYAANASNKWLIYLEGGGHCFSRESCQQRWIRVRTLMTSAHWPMMRSMGGIFSLSPDENPHWHHANHVLIPYCSSDSWSGNSYASKSGEFSFLGANILEQVVVELMPLGLKDANVILLAGSSAGAVGVMVNLDRISNVVSTFTSTANVIGLADSGWFIDNVPYSSSNNNLYTSYTSKSHSVSKSDSRESTSSSTSNSNGSSIRSLCQQWPHACPPDESIKLGYKYWNGVVPKDCYAEHSSEPWRCYFGYRIYSTLKTPLFIVQWIFDEAQMTFDNVAHPMSKEEWNYIHKLGQDLKRTFTNVTALFAPSCVSHTVLTKRSWSDTRVSGTSLPDALNCWEHEQLHRHLQNPQQHHHRQAKQSIVHQNGYTVSPVSSALSGFPPVGLNKRKRHVATEPLAFSRTNEPTGPLLLLAQQQQQHHHHHQQQQQQQQQRDAPISPTIQQVSLINQTTAQVTNQKAPPAHIRVPLIEERSGQRKRKRKHRKNGRRKNKMNKPHHVSSNNDPSSSSPSSSQSLSSPSLPFLSSSQSSSSSSSSTSYTCKHKFIDKCSWPQCNRECPRLRNPFTGKEMDFIELFKGFGLDMAEVADALNMDESTLSRMDHEQLLHHLSNF